MARNVYHFKGLHGKADKDVAEVIRIFVKPEWLRAEANFVLY
jgi:hypothetical protein